MIIRKQIYIEDLTEPEVREIEERMRPGNMSESGFLDYTQRLREVIDADRRELEHLGTSYDEIARLLERIAQRDQQHNGTRVGNKGGLKIRIIEYRGLQYCPFYYRETRKDGKIHRESCGSGSVDYRVERRNKDLVIPQLMIHLVRDHHFFEGNIPYRLDVGQIDAIKAAFL